MVHLAPLLDALRVTGAGFAWLEQGLARLAASPDAETDLSMLSARARRSLGSARLAAGPLWLATPAGGLDIGGWAAGDAARVALLLAAVQAHPARSFELITALFRQGDEQERAAVVRGLVLLPGGERLKPLALEAGRANSLVLFSALALGNPYPASYYTDQEFNQMVLKAIFIGLSVEAISGLAGRANPELCRMCEDYVEERVAAGRPVPFDLWLALGPCAGPRGEQLMLEYAHHEDPRHRYYAALALLDRQGLSPSARQALGERLLQETDQRVLAVLRGLRR